MVLETDDSGLEKILEEHSLVLVDLWAPWCGPCKMIGPVLDALEGEMSDVFFCKINIDENKMTAQKNGVMSIPTLLLYKDKEVVEKIVGAIPKESIQEKIQAHL